MSEKRTKENEILENSQPEKDQTQEVKFDDVEISREQSKQAEKLSEARQEVKAESVSESSDKVEMLDKLKAEDKAPDIDMSRMPASSDLKKATFQKEIGHIRRKLNKSDRLGSRIIHQPFIRNVSETSSKTITRPSGLLGGGITAFLGTSIYLYLTKQLGLKYNYAIFLLLLVAGFVLGLLIEALFRMTRGKRSA